MEHIDNPTLEQLDRIAADQNVNTSRVSVKYQRIDDFFKRFGEIVMESAKEIEECDLRQEDLLRIIRSCRWYAKHKCGGKVL